MGSEVDLVVCILSITRLFRETSAGLEFVHIAPRTVSQPLMSP